jgi:threonyl-tRNA synthetase
MAEAVTEMFPEAKLGIGPPIDTGFYYDFDLPRALSTEDLPVIEEKMRARIASNVPFEPSQISKDEAQRRFAGQPYKIELIDGIEDETVGLYQQGEFIDLCQGPHVARTGEVPVFKLMSVAGAYWRGNEKNPMLQRIYGALFDTKEELDAYLEQIEEALRRDHRKLGRELDLFSFHEEFGPGLVYWHPKGGRIRTEIEDFWRQEHCRHGYDLVFTPPWAEHALGDERHQTSITRHARRWTSTGKIIM